MAGKCSAGEIGHQVEDTVAAFHGSEERVGIFLILATASNFLKSEMKYKILRIAYALIWLANGLLCKVLNLVPRHQEIVAAIFGQEHARLLTVAIGISEVLMAVWILSGIRSRLNAIVQMLVIAVMNTLEFFLVPHLLLWGRFNAAFALLLILVIYYNEFHLKPKIRPHS